MSRLIVKNLPNKATVEQLKEVFVQKGEVTDVQLKYTKDGKFRNFGFVGYKTEEEATNAKEYFDGSCINSMKISVEICANLGDAKKPRAWSKYAPDSTAYKTMNKSSVENQENEKNNSKKKRLNKNDKIKELLEKHKNDPLFNEFIEAHVNEKTAWIKETLDKIKTNENDNSIEEDKTETQSHTEITQQIEPKKDTCKVANKKISDLEYMKILMKKTTSENSENDTGDQRRIRNRPLFHIKISGLPFKCKKKDIKEFFRPLVPFSIRLPLGKEKKIAGFCFVGFRTEEELKKALFKDKLFMGKHRIHIHKHEDKNKSETIKQEEIIKREKQQKDNDEESIGESGSIFIRNLPYVVTEDEVTRLFEKYGPIAEINMPIDKILRQPKGFATVTFMMPEHAVKAYTELDGTIFCGRMLHLLPAKAEKDKDDDNDDDLTFKEKKAKKLKSQAKSSHNWNTLFLGANAVADVVAANYSTTKENLLIDNNKNTSAAVRLALGETQLVAETRNFLETNGVYLEAFNKAPKMRSKTCILLKNLPANTTQDEIRPLFEKHGQIARFIMPKHGITALIEFVEPYEAKNAFTKLAYSQFKTTPLYLEWAPDNVFLKQTNKIELPDDKNTEVKNKEEETIKQEVDDKIIQKNEVKEDFETSLEEPELDTTLFVKNLNFKTTEETLRSHFAVCGKLHSVTIAKKKDPKHPGQFLSMGYGFIQYYSKSHTNEALKSLQYSILDDKTLELKRSEKGSTNEINTARKTNKNINQNGTKILVRNVPFQANRNELHEIFRAFGEIKSLRLPKKLTPGSDQHRGFAFVDYHSKSDAKSAFEALCQSTHLYGRRLVLEWADLIDETEGVETLRKRTAQLFNTKAPGGKKSKKATVDSEQFVEAYTE